MTGLRQRRPSLRLLSQCLRHRYGSLHRTPFRSLLRRLLAQLWEEGRNTRAIATERVKRCVRRGAAGCRDEVGKTLKILSHLALEREPSLVPCRLPPIVQPVVDLFVQGGAGGREVAAGGCLYLDIRMVGENVDRRRGWCYRKGAKDDKGKSGERGRVFECVYVWMRRL